MRDAEALVAAHPHLTRLTSSLDAREMTLDPTFELNADMTQDISQLHEAIFAYDCAGGELFDAPRTLTVEPEGWIVALPTARQALEQEIDLYDYVSSLTTFAALRIERTSATGEPEVVADQTPWLEAELAKYAPGGGTPGDADGDGIPDEDEEPPCCKPDASGCGCATGGAAGWWSGLAALLAVASRRVSARTGARPA